MFRSILRFLPFCLVAWLARRYCSRREVSGEKMVQPFPGVLIAAPDRPYRPSLMALLKWWWKPNSDNGMSVLIELCPALTTRDLSEAVDYIEAVQRANGVERATVVRVRLFDHEGKGTIVGSRGDSYEVQWDAPGGLPEMRSPGNLQLIAPDEPWQPHF